MVFSLSPLSLSVSSSSSTYFPPQSISRPKKNRTTTKPKHGNGGSTRKLPLRKLTSSPAGEATSYTRLPPKEDFILPSLSHLFQSPAEEVKISEAALKNIAISKPETEVVGDEEELLVTEKQVSRDDSKFDYGKFELFDLNSDVESDNGDEKLGFRSEGPGGLIDGEGTEDGEDMEVDEDGNFKEKGVPAVMRCFDRAKIYAQSGDGGNGVVAFRREKFVPFGGPSGGDGGRGGNVYVEVDGALNSLLPFRKNIHFRGGRGSHGQGSKMNGAKGEDVVVKVPPGTVIREAGSDGIPGDVLLELMIPGQRALLLPGGKGGRGNASFKSGTNKVPKIAELGEEGPDM